MAPPTTAKGYAISDQKKFTDFKVHEYPLKPESPRDVTVQVDFCGVCGSDVHTVDGGWGPLSSEFCVPGHEIIGKVTHVGSDASSEFKVGQRVGVGAQVGSCLKCNRCKNDNENYCPEMVDTYNSYYPDGTLAQGGYSTTVRVDQQFVFAIPDALKSEDAAPMLCAGLTCYSPLVRNGVGPGSKVGIVGMGGLGHFAIQFAKALGAEVTLFSHSPSKGPDALRLGADRVVCTGDSDWTSYFGAGKEEFDFLLSTADAHVTPITELMATLKLGGKIVSVGLPNDAFGLKAQAFMPNMACLGGSHIGSKKECIAMLDLAAEKGIKPIIDQILPMSQAGKAIQSVHDGKVRYRFVLKQDLL